MVKGQALPLLADLIRQFRHAVIKVGNRDLACVVMQPCDDFRQDANGVHSNPAEHS